MNNKETTKEFVDAFMRDVPRGVRTRLLREQSLPQARWADPAHILVSKTLAYDPANPGNKILLGALGDQLIGFEDNRHILTVAGSRAGKSVTAIANALFYPNSMLASDPKAELANITARARMELGQRVLILDPLQICADRLSHLRASFNFMVGLKIESPTIIEDSDQIAEAMVTSVSQKDPHWDESAKNIIAGIILDTATSLSYKGKRNLVTVRARLNAALRCEDLNPDDEEDNRVVFILEEEMRENAYRLKRSQRTYDIGCAIEAASRDFFDKSYKERDSVLSTARRHTRFLDYAGIRSVCQDHDFDLADLKREKITVYLCVPASQMGAYARWLRLFYSQLLTAMERVTQAPQEEVLALLDELPIYGPMKALEDAVGQIASFGVKLWFICQDWGQGKTLYKERWESFAANAGIMQFFGNTDIATLEYLSRKLGKTTVPVTREAETSAEQAQNALSGRSSDLHLHDLLSPHEIALLCARDNPARKQILLPAGRLPILAQRIEYFDEDSPLHHYFAGRYDPPR